MFNDNENPHNNRWVTQETQLQALQIRTHLEEISFDITNTGKHDIILGRPWHKRYNPTVDWVTEDIDFDKCLCHSKPGWKDQVKIITCKQINAIARKTKQALTIDYWKGSNESTIPELYQRFRKVFTKAEDMRLPEHKP